MIYSTGKRKSSVARVFLKEGSGILTINNSLDYFKSFKKCYEVIKQPLYLFDLVGKFDILITVKGGGLTGQAEAIRHGLSKALVLFNQKNENFYFNLKKTLKDFKLLTRDSRKVERKKVGRRKARKKEQYSKR